MVHLSELNQKLLEVHRTLNLELDISKGNRTLHEGTALTIKNKQIKTEII